MSGAKQGAVLFVSQLVSYTIVTMNFRYVAQGNLAAALATDALHASLSFFVIRRIAQGGAETFAPWLGYLLGSLAGTAIGMRLSE